MGKLIKIDGALAIRKTADLNEYLKPMSRDILLFSTKIGNTYKVKDKMPLMKLAVGERLYFKRTESKYEDNVIMIYTPKEELVGFVPEVDSAVFARLMDAGKMLFACVKSISHGTSVPLIDIDIYLQDF